MGYRLNKIKILILDGSTEIVVDVFEILKDVFAEVVHNDLWPRGVQTRFRAVDQEWQVKHGSDIIIALAIILVFLWANQINYGYVKCYTPYKFIVMSSPSKLFSCVDAKAILNNPVNDSQAKFHWSFAKGTRFAKQKGY